MSTAKVLRGKAPLPLLERIERKINRNAASGCWDWIGAFVGNGYGQLTIGSNINGTRRKALAHRVAYEIIVGPIPDGLEIDHLCRNRRCVNPAHLEPVTRKENVRRGLSPQLARERQTSITHCPAGHSYDADNTRYTRKGTRACKKCGRRKCREQYWKRKQSTPSEPSSTR